jgi:hypothetical protein
MLFRIPYTKQIAGQMERDQSGISPPYVTGNLTVTVTASFYFVDITVRIIVRTASVSDAMSFISYIFILFMSASNPVPQMELL